MSVILDKYNDLGGENSFLGKPLHEEKYCPDGIGKYVTFQRESDGLISSIHFHPVLGCHETHGLIREKWESLGFEKGRLGYPISDEIAIPINHFLRGMNVVTDDGNEIPPSENVFVSYFDNGFIVYYPETNEVKEYDNSKSEIIPPKSFLDKIIHKIYNILPNPP